MSAHRLLVQFRSTLLPTTPAPGFTDPGAWNGRGSPDFSGATVGDFRIIRKLGESTTFLPFKPPFSSPLSLGKKEEGRREGYHLTIFLFLLFVGSGTFGEVKLCHHVHTGALYCLKILDKQKIIRLKQEEHVRNEKITLSQCEHPFIVKL
jgi:serine/threonine protein kinase